MNILFIAIGIIVVAGIGVFAWTGLKGTLEAFIEALFKGRRKK